MTPAEYNLALSKHLRTLRLAHKYTQEAMAKVMYLQSPHSYAHYERGTLMVKAHMLYLIEREFKMDAGSIMSQVINGIWVK